MSRGRLCLIAAMALGMTPVPGWGGVSALAATTACNGNTSGAEIRVDVNGDGCADAVVGMPDRTVGGVAYAGAIEVSLGSSGYNRLRARTVLVTAEHPHAGDHFGASITTTDARGGFSTIVIGVPGRDVAGVDNSGAVVALSNIASWPDVVRVKSGAFRVITSRPHPEARLGSTVVAANDTTSTTVTPVVYVGAPGWVVGGQPSAGAVLGVTRDRLIGDGGPSPRVITEDSTGVAGRARNGDRFGGAIAAYGNEVLAVGAPGKTVDGRLGAGAVLTLTGSGTSAGRMLTQDSTRDPNTPERGDHFGTVLAGVGDSLYIAVPDEDVQSATDAGIVERFTLGGAYRETLQQGADGYRGRPEAGDHFGAALSVIWESNAAPFSVNCALGDLAVGVPGEDVDSRPDAGEVDCPNTPPLRMGGQLPGSLWAHGRVGASLSTIQTGHWAPAKAGGQPQPYLTLLIGAPGIRDGRGGVITGTDHASAIWHRSDDPPNTHYGASLLEPRSE